MIYIRVDMNEQIATGHVMRCLAIADAARKKNEETMFILADENAVPLLKQREYSYFVLHTKWNCMEQEISALSLLIHDLQIETLLIDSYQVTNAYLEAVRKLVRIAYIDDVNAMTYPVDMLICYANYWKKFQYGERYTNTKLLLGTKYVPLRAVFCNRTDKTINQEIQNVLILTGGTDVYEAAKGILEALDLQKYQRIDVICGMYYQNYEKTKNQFLCNPNVVFHQSVVDMETYMLQADVAISAGGTTLYELCACGTPTISYVIADNQKDNVISFDEQGLITYAGDVREDDIYTTIRQLLENEYCSYTARLEKSKNMQKKVDGCGAERLVQELGKM